MYDVLKKAQKEINKFNADFKRTKHYNTGINTAWLKLEKYFKLTDFSPLYVTAIILHPTQQFKYFKDKWAEYPSWVKTARKAFKDLFLSYCEKVPNINSAFNFKNQPNNAKSSYLAYDEFLVNYLLRKYYKQKKKDMDSLELNTYLRSFNCRLLLIKDPLIQQKEY